MSVTGRIQQTEQAVLLVFVSCIYFARFRTRNRQMKMSPPQPDQNFRRLLNLILIVIIFAFLSCSTTVQVVTINSLQMRYTPGKAGQFVAVLYGARSKLDTQRG